MLYNLFGSPATITRVYTCVCNGNISASFARNVLTQPWGEQSEDAVELSEANVCLTIKKHAQGLVLKRVRLARDLAKHGICIPVYGNNFRPLVDGEYLLFKHHTLEQIAEILAAYELPTEPTGDILFSIKGYTKRLHMAERDAKLLDINTSINEGHMHMLYVRDGIIHYTYFSEFEYFEALHSKVSKEIHYNDICIGD